MGRAGTRSALEVAHQTDSDAVFVVVVAVGFAVCAGNLLPPPAADLHVSIWRTGSVTDDKVIAQTSLPAPAEVVTVEGLGVALVSGAVVEHDVGPLAVFATAWVAYFFATLR